MANNDNNLEHLTPQLIVLVTEVVNRIFNNEGRQMINSILNPNAEISAARDLEIRPEHANGITELDKIPDIVKSLREFSGNPTEFSSWKKSVDRILRIYTPLLGTPKYYGILSVIRNKITGRADSALESYNTPLDWKAISRCLTLHYADKRDLGTLEYQMTSLIQGNSTIQEFYQAVYTHLSLILNKISCMDISSESTSLLTATYRDKALDTFIRGLKGDLPRLLGIREPADLPQALHLCLKLENQNFRSSYANNQQFTNKLNSSIKPQIPPRRFNSQHQAPMQKEPFFPQLVHFPYNNQQYRSTWPTQKNQTSFQRFNQNNQYNPFAQGPPRPQPRPVPMETSTIQSAQVNYQNRPSAPFKYAGKRPHGPPIQNPIPNKYQRNYHLQAEQENLNNYFQNLAIQDNEYEENVKDYLQSQECSNPSSNNEIPEYTDLNFLG